MTLAYQELVEEVSRRTALVSSLFPKQHAAWSDPSDRKAILTSRRAGKTELVIRDCVHDARHRTDTDYAYVALTRRSAEEIVWNRILKPLNRKYQLCSEFREQKLRMILPGNCRITLFGADKPGWMETFRGSYYRRVILDECGSYRINLDKFVHEIVEPTLVDQQGTLWMVGTPGRVPSGMWWEMTRPEVALRRPGWSFHNWTVEDNPHMREQFRKLYARKKALNPDIDTDPSFLREWRGLWVVEDQVDNVYGFSPERNVAAVHEKDPEDHYVLGVDFGWHDDTAFVVGVWREDSPTWTVLESYKAPHLDITATAERIKEYIERYPGVHIVGDQKRSQLLEEMRVRHGIPLARAEKADKHDWIRLINTDLRAGNILVVDPDSQPLVDEWIFLKKKHKPNGDWVEHPGQPNHCADAHLYAYRYAHHYRFEPIEEPMQKFSRQWWDREEELMIQEEEDRVSDKNEEWI